MVDHDHDRVKPKREREIGNQVHRDLLEWAGGHGGKGSQGGRGGVGIHLVRLADGTAHDKTMDKHVQLRPPKVPGHEVLGPENAAMTPGSRLMEGGDDVTAGPLGHVETPLEVKLPLLVEPVHPLGTRKERCSLIEGLEGREDKGVRGGRQGDLVREGDIDGASEKC
jgi:hypothetical protein